MLKFGNENWISMQTASNNANAMHRKINNVSGNIM